MLTTEPSRKVSRRANRLGGKGSIAGYLFVAPMMLGLIILTIIPTLITLILSFTDWSFIAGFDKIRFIGFRNYEQLFNDHVFKISFKNNLILLLVVPVQLIFSLLFAVLIDRYVYLKSLLKIVFFMPYISSIVAVAIVFQLLFHPSFGPINQTLRALGMTDPPKWLASMQYALPSVMIILVWVGIGFCLIIYLAALQAIPRDLYEAADIDGAGSFTKFRKITFPLVSPTTFFLLVTGLISTFKSFDIIKVLTDGGPSYSTSVVTHYLYNTAFEGLKTGYASSMAWILLGCVMLITLVQLYGQKKWVNY